MKAEKIGVDTIMVVLNRRKAETLCDLCCYIECRNVGATTDMLRLCEELGPSLEQALGQNEGNGDE